MIGRRVYSPTKTFLPIDLEPLLQPGDYWKFEPHDLWVVCAPNGDMGGINSKTWTITEHEDGTITVSPSILIYKTEGVTKGWHGYLERGVWREC